MKLKNDIIEVLKSCATSQFKDISFIPEKHITEAEFSYVADKILTLIQSNGDSQPNGRKPIVSGRSEQFYCVSSNALVYGKPCEKWCGDENCKALCKQ